MEQVRLGREDRATTYAKPKKKVKNKFIYYSFI